MFFPSIGTGIALNTMRSTDMEQSPRKILIIEPDAQERRRLASDLRHDNYEIETGERLADAIKKLAGGAFGCLILDVDLPEMKGYEAVSILKNIDPKVKIIMTTSKNSKHLEAKVRAEDIFYYFIKSFGREELKMAIKNAFRK
jgi:two-component system KDP operon response regulator KdpE